MHFLQRFSDRVAEHRFPAVAANGVDLGRHGIAGHVDPGLNSEQARRIRNSLAMIPGRKSYDATRKLLRGELQHCVFERAAKTQRPVRWKFSALSENRVPVTCSASPSDERSPVEMRHNPFPGGVNVVYRDRQTGDRAGGRDVIERSGVPGVIVCSFMSITNGSTDGV